jgi:hypothetical protein
MYVHCSGQDDSLCTKGSFVDALHTSKHVRRVPPNWKWILSIGGSPKYFRIYATKWAA